jgi:hypothetical protein
MQILQLRPIIANRAKALQNARDLTELIKAYKKRDNIRENREFIKDVALGNMPGIPNWVDRSQQPTKKNLYAVPTF